MKCQWKECNGIIGSEGRCIMCGHSLNIAEEELIERKKAEAKSYYSRFSTEYTREARLRKKYK